VIVTVLDEPIREKSDTWAELDKIVSDMDEDEKPRLEDYPRMDFGRELATLECSPGDLFVLKGNADIKQARDAGISPRLILV